MLRLESVTAGYGPLQVLFGVDLEVAAGEVVTLMGRNGMGKTTTIRSVLRLLKPSGGRILFDGRDVTGLPSHRMARLGIALVPEGRQVFPTLTVRENLVATARPPLGEGQAWDLAAVYGLFPRLRERAGQYAKTLSGGEQQMLAIGRALMTNPRLLILDEATEGLAPKIRAEIWACFRRLKAAGLTILIVDKNLKELAAFADRHSVMEKGRIVWQGDAAALAADRERLLGLLSV